MQKRNISRTVWLLATVFILKDVPAQNVGIGVKEPLEKLQVNGNLLIQQPYRNTNTAPTAGQTKVMVNGLTISFPSSDSTGALYDPGGPAGNYLANMSASGVIIAGTNYAIELTINDIDLNTGDSLIIKNNSGLTLFNRGDGYSLTGRYVFNASGLTIIFKSNSDGFTGSGFGLLFKRLYILQLPASNSAFGNAVYFDAANGIFRAGRLSYSEKGDYSIAMGNNTTASGIESTATGLNTIASGDRSTAMGLATNATGFAATSMGQNTKAGGDYSTAMGYNTVASGDYSISMGYNTIGSGVSSTAMGQSTTASGFYSTAMGQSTTASGLYSTAAGYNTTASGLASTALGTNVTTNNQEGSFIIGDGNSSRGIYYSDVPNQMQMIFGGGYRLYTGSSNFGVYMNAGANSWSAVSDSTKKEKLLLVNGEDFLYRIAHFKLGTWNYKEQNSKTFRHYGPMAQDFYAAFGKDSLGTIGCDTLINQQDFLGVNLIAIQALVKRTEALGRENEALRQELGIIKGRLDEIDNDKKNMVKGRK
jgi:hypothetical protein